MPTIPKIKVLTNTSDAVINAIRNNASQRFQDYVPIATPDAESIKAIGNIIMDYPALQNEFVSALVNRIASVVVSSKVFHNPYSFVKKGVLGFGETVEELFVDIARPRQFDPPSSEEKFAKRELPNVRSAFHPLNYQKFYKVTISEDMLRQAFLSMDGITDLVGRITDSLYSGANYDEFLVMRYMIAKAYLNNNIYALSTQGTADENKAKKTGKTIQATTGLAQFMTTTYNAAGVRTFTSPQDMYIFMSVDFNANMNFEVLASAFNIDKVEFMGRRVIVPDFYDFDYDRLEMLLENYPDYKRFTQEEINKLKKIQALIVDKDWFMIFDNLQKFTEFYNGEGLYWNYFYHTWKTFSYSPFHTAIAVIDGEVDNTISGANTLVIKIGNDQTANKASNLPDETTYIFTDPKGKKVNIQYTDPDGEHPYTTIQNGNQLVVGTIPNGYDGTASNVITVVVKSVGDGDSNNQTLKFYHPKG